MHSQFSYSCTLFQSLLRDYLFQHPLPNQAIVKYNSLSSSMISTTAVICMTGILPAPMSSRLGLLGTSATENVSSLSRRLSSMIGTVKHLRNALALNVSSVTAGPV